MQPEAVVGRTPESLEVEFKGGRRALEPRGQGFCSRTAHEQRDASTRSTTTRGEPSGRPVTREGWHHRRP